MLKGQPKTLLDVQLMICGRRLMRPWPLIPVFLTLLAAGSAHATITVLDYWHLGENDPGAVSGGFCINTVDAVGGKTLTNTLAGGNYPTYTSGVGLAASAETSSTLALSLTNGQYGTGLLATSATDNFGIECWVNPGTNTTGGHVLAYNGLRGNGWGLYQGGTNFEVLYGGSILFGSAPAAAGVWTHLALVRNNGVAILYTNGVPASTNSSTPLTPTGSFTVGGDATFPEYFTGAIDEVRVFTFAPGAFSTNDLLLNSTNLVVSNTNDAGAGSLRNAIAYAPSGAAITFANTLSGATILLSQPLTLNQSVSINASALPNGVILNGNAAGSVFYATGGTDVLTGLTITNGNGLNGIGGGGIYNTATLTVNQCTLAGNTTPDFGGGGGICNNGGTLNVNDSTFTRNVGLLGGGGIANYGNVSINCSTFAGNSASSGPGGGLWNYGGSLNLTNSIICGNVAASNSNLNGSITSGANNLVDANALLAVPGYYGGPTATMPPLAGSPAIDAGSDAVLGFLLTDQRGHPRKSGGHVDIGAVEVDPNTIVTNLADGGPGTLRTVIASLASPDLVSFAPNLSGQTISLNSPINLTQSVALDASALTNGIILDGQNSTRILNAASGTTSVLTGLALINGVAIGGQSPVYGGAIVNSGSLTFNQCTFSGNSIQYGFGGMIYNRGALTLNACSVYNNSANGNSGVGGGSGAIYNDGTATLVQCTLTGNAAKAGIGGAIFNEGMLTLTQCTLCSNSASSSGGAIFTGTGATATLINTIVAGSIGSDDFSSDNSTNIFLGANIVQSSDYYGGTNIGSIAITANPQLAPLGNYGGPTPTMPPLFGSPAINAGRDASAGGLTTDQRGQPRVSGTHVDIGSVEYQVGPVVASPADTGENTLRAAVTYNAAGTVVTFAPNLSAQTINLTSGQIVLSNNLAIDASALAGGVTVSGNLTSRVFLINPGVTNTFTGLAIAFGKGIGPAPLSGYGGGIYNQGNLTLIQCTIAFNSCTTAGAGIYTTSAGELTLQACTLADNSAPHGGAVQNEGVLAAYNSTFTGNTASSQGGAISAPFSAPTALTLCTLTVNSSGDGGGVYGNAVNLTNTIVAGNSATTSPNLSGTFTLGGNDLIGGSPGLAALGYYGGPTPTMPPTNGSPAIDTGAATIFTTDQRGYPRPSGAGCDLGAVEVQVASAPFVLTGTNGAVGTVRLANGQAQINFTNLLGGNFTVFASTNVALPFNTWSNLGPAVETPVGSGQFQFNDPQATNFSRRFYRVRSP